MMTILVIDTLADKDGQFIHARIKELEKVGRMAFKEYFS